MTQICTSRGIGLYVAAEAHTLCYGKFYQADASKRAAIVFTGGPGDDRDFLTATASGSQIPPALAAFGVPLISAAFGGANQWGNDTSQTRIGQAWTYIKSALNPKQDQFIGIGVSKGATALLNYTRANPANVAALLLIVPAVNVVDIHDNNRGGNAANVESAYGSLANWQAAAATHDPAQNTATHLSQAIPTKIIHGGADTVCVSTVVQAFATAIGAQRVYAGDAYDHLTTAPTVDPVADAWNFIKDYA